MSITEDNFVHNGCQYSTHSSRQLSDICIAVGKYRFEDGSSTPE